jgi:hypothetical protein
MFLAATVSGAVTNAPAGSTNAVSRTPTTPREIYNAGTRNLRAAKYREAEALLESALTTQDEAIQPAALYNLGHVRFNQGLEELKKGPAAGGAAAKGQEEAQRADSAIQLANVALAENNVQKMVDAYIRGRGQRRELKAALSAVKKALDVFGATLRKWQRSAGDFRGAAELNPKDEDASHNARVVDQCIARLVDSLRELQSAAAMAGSKNQELGQKLKELKGRIPAPDMPPGAAGDDEEDEDEPQGPKPGEKEGPSQEGKEMRLSAEEASWLLDGYKLGGDRRLPMGQERQAQPKDRPRRPW